MPLSAIIGHRDAVGLLRRAVAQDRVPQSLLFAGPEGVGKHAVALALAQAVNCPRRRDHQGDACGVCSTCVRIARGQHSDVTVLDKGEDASIKIKPLRERVLDVVGYRPFEAERRVFIIDPADELGREAAQAALLKTLEEPPPAVILILVTAYADTLLPTIQSRCRRLRFGPLSESDVARVLVERCAMDATSARVLAAASGGSVERALAGAGGDLEDDRAAAVGLLAAAARGRGVIGRLRAAAEFAQHEKSRRSRDALGARLAIVASLLRDLGALAAGDAQAVANVDLTDTLRELTGGFDMRRAADAFGAVTRARADIDRNANPKIVADWVALTI